MRHSKSEKAATHERILEVASARMRESGTEAPGVAEIMSAAGLTHGGFYKHFGSRDDLVAEALAKAFADTEAATQSLLENSEDPLAAFVDTYASIEHCENPATGCAIPMLGCDVARGDERLRAIYRGQVERYLAFLEQQLGPDNHDARQRAVVALSALVGAVIVARAVDDKMLAEEILNHVRATVKSSNRHQLTATPTARPKQRSRRR